MTGEALAFAGVAVVPVGVGAASRAGVFFSGGLDGLEPCAGGVAGSSGTGGANHASSTSRSRAPFGGPTMPRFSMPSTIFAARL